VAAGLPGIGLSGLFTLLSALLMPPIELVRTLAGRSSWQRWRVVGRQWLIAVFMILTYAAAAVALRRLLSALGGVGPQQHWLSGWSVLLISSLILAGQLLLLAAAAGRSRRHAADPGGIAA
jgi:hypothetical protein